MYKVALSSCGKEINEALFEQYKQAGIAAMEIALKPEEYDAFDYAKVKELADASGVELWSVHLPFYPFETLDISAVDPELRQRSVEYLAGIIRQAGSVGIDKYVIHPSIEPISDEIRPAKMKAAKESLVELAAVAKEYGGYVAVENLPRTCLGKNAAEMKELVEACDDLRVCFDTNHLLGEDFEAMFEAVGDKMITVHISDYDFVDERHWLPGEGKLDWQRMLKCFEKVNYQGMWLYEIGPDAPATLSRSRKLTCEDFARNAAELFEDKELIRIV